MKLTTIAAAALAALIGGAAAAQDITEFRIGILGGENANDRLRSNECVRAYAEEALGVPTKVFAPADYNGVIEGLLGGSIDMAWLGASAYAKVYLTNPEAAEPVLVKVNADGSRGYHSIAFARVDSGITSLETAKGRVFALGDPNSTSGYLIPKYELTKAGIDLTPGAYFSDVKSSGGHEQSIIGVYNKDFDVSVAWADGLGDWEDGFNSGAFRKAADAGLVDMTQMTEIWRSPFIPEGPIVLRKSLPADAKAKITALLQALPEKDKDCTYSFMAGEVKGLEPIGHDAYAGIVEMRKAAN